MEIPSVPRYFKLICNSPLQGQGHDLDVLEYSDIKVAENAQISNEFLIYSYFKRDLAYRQLVKGFLLI